MFSIELVEIKHHRIENNADIEVICNTVRRQWQFDNEHFLFWSRV